MSLYICPCISSHEIALGFCGSQYRFLKTSVRWHCASAFHGKSKCLLLLAMASSYSQQHEQEQGQVNKKFKQKHEFDAMQDLILSSSPPPKQKDSKGKSPPTTALDREALAIVGSPNFSLRDRADAMNGLLDLLKQKGVSPAYAFQFTRHAGKLIDELIIEAKQSVAAKHTLERQGGLVEKDIGITGVEVEEFNGVGNVKEPLAPFKRKPGFGLEDPWRVLDNPSIASKVYVCAERRGIARLVVYFQILNMKASDIPSVIPYAGGRIDAVMAKVEFLRSIGVRSQHLPSVIASWPPILSYQCDSLASVVEYLKIIGIPHKEIVAIIVKHPEVLGQSVELELKRTINFLQEVGSSLKDVKSLITLHPSLLLENVKVKLWQLVNYLMSVGVKQMHIGPLLVRRPALINSNLEKDVLPVIDYLKKLHASADDIDKIITSFPGLFCYDLEKLGIAKGELHKNHDDDAERAEFLQLLEEEEVMKVEEMEEDSLERVFSVASRIIELLNPLEQRRKPRELMERSLWKKLKKMMKVWTWIPARRKLDVGDFRPAVSQLESLGVDPGLMGKLFRRHPQLLKNRMNFGLKVQFLLKLGLEKEDMGRVIYNAPQLLGLREEKLKPTVNFLQNIGVTGSSLRKVLKVKPMVLAYSVESKLQPNINFIQNLGIDKLDIAKLVTRHPQLLTLSVEKNLEPTVSFFLDLGFTREEVADMLRRLPSLLGFSVSNVLEPKYKFFMEAMQRSPKELVRFPQYFSYSLDRRIIPRYISLGERHLKYSLGTIFACKDAVFEKKISRWNSDLCED